ncbi:hypothetical protein CEXT_61471, partial [Caerostris extrusa]
MVRRVQKAVRKRVLEKYPGKDGIVRLVKLRTGKGNIKKPIQRLYPLELTPTMSKSYCKLRRFRK